MRLASYSSSLSMPFVLAAIGGCMNIQTAFATEDEMSLRESLAKLKTFFVIQGVLLLIYIAIAVGAILLGGLASLAAFSL